MKTCTLSNLDIAKMQADLYQARVVIMRLERENAELVKQQQCLAEIKAEAGRAGYLQGVYDFQEADSKHENFFNDSRADEYAAKIRKGEQSGTWLKDSNVNGGKRQGEV